MIQTRHYMYRVQRRERMNSYGLSREVRFCSYLNCGDWKKESLLRLEVYFVPKQE